MRASLISLDLMIAMPIVLLAFGLFLGYGYAAIKHSEYNTYSASRTLELYASSVALYNETSALSGLALALPYTIYSSENITVDLQNPENLSECNTNVCRFVVIGGATKLMVIK